MTAHTDAHSLEIRTNWIGGEVSEDEGREIRKILREAGETKMPRIETRYVQNDRDSMIAVRIKTPTVPFTEDMQRSIERIFRGSVVSTHIA